MKKKILFVLPHMLCGGVEKALLSLINELPKNDFDISILVVKMEGDFVNIIPNDIKAEEILLDNTIRNELMLGGIKSSLKYYVSNKHPIKFIKVVCNVLKKEPLATLTYSFNKIQPLEEIYDTAICFHIHMPFIVKYVAEKVQASNKIAWIHNDFKMSGFNVKRLKPILNSYNHFFAVSEQLMEEFVEIFPCFKSCTSIAHNIVSENYIRQSLCDSFVDEYNKHEFKILSIGRLDKQKGFDIAIKACKELCNAGLQFKWYVLGTGVEEKNLRKQVYDLDLTDTFIFLGIRVNPYPYIDQCDLYVQPSRHEGYGIAVAEARMLNKPIICTDFIGARDQLIDGETGLIVGVDSYEIASAVKKMITDKNLMKLFSNNLMNMQKYDKNEINNIIKFF